MMRSRTAILRSSAWGVVALVLVVVAAAVTAFAVTTDDAAGAALAKRRVAFELVFNSENIGTFALTSPRST